MAIPCAELLEDSDLTDNCHCHLLSDIDCGDWRQQRQGPSQIISWSMRQSLDGMLKLKSSQDFMYFCISASNPNPSAATGLGHLFLTSLARSRVFHERGSQGCSYRPCHEGGA